MPVAETANTMSNPVRRFLLRSVRGDEDGKLLGGAWRLRARSGTVTTLRAGSTSEAQDVECKYRSPFGRPCGRGGPKGPPLMPKSSLL